jgi:hypothetical protein
MPDYRDCYDFKFKKTDIESDPSKDSLLLQGIWQDVYDAQAAAVDDYRRDYNIMPLKYWEALTLSSMDQANTSKNTMTMDSLITVPFP